jgi:hypothetical protein
VAKMMEIFGLLDENQYLEAGKHNVAGVGPVPNTPKRSC